MTSADHLSKQLDDLWQKHLPLMKSRVESIRLAVDALQKDRLTQEIQTAAKQAAHKLAGSLGTFGLESASSDASTIEQILADIDSTGGNTNPLERRLTRIKQAIEGRGKGIRS